MQQFTRWGALLALLSLAACVEEYGARFSEGDTCRSSVECAPGLVCISQRCATPDDAALPGAAPPPQTANPINPPQERPPFPGIPGTDEPADSGVADTGDDTGLPDSGVDADLPDPDGGALCTPGERSCESNTVSRTCRPDAQSFERTTCAQGTTCVDGACINSSGCNDRDRDGFNSGPLCSGTQDCNDSNPLVNPRAPEVCDGLDNDCDGFTDEDTTLACASPCGEGIQRCVDGLYSACSAPDPRPEICGNGLDEDCDGRPDDGCAMCCTPGSCGDGALCVDCTCQDAPSNRCRFQNQPCDPNLTGGDGDLICLDFGGNGRDGLCVALCQTDAPDPDATCPGGGATCVFGDDIQGICLDRCDIATQTGCFEGQGCLAVGAGACVPAGDLPEGASCDINTGSFGQCEAGTACLDLDGNQGTCERICNPAAGFDGRATGCDSDQGCFPFSPDTGVCLPALDLNPNDACSRFQADSALSLCRGQSACTRVSNGRFACEPLCRLDRGDADCNNNERCRTSNIFDGSSGFGVCQ